MSIKNINNNKFYKTKRKKKPFEAQHNFKPTFNNGFLIFI